MRKLIIFQDGAQAVVENVELALSSPIAEEIDLDALPEEERKELVKNRRKITIERDKKGKVTAIKLGKKNLKRSRNG